MMALAWISGGEILLAAVVGLLVFGGRLPEVMKDLGRVFFKVRRSLDELRRETGLDRTLRELEWESRKIRDEVNYSPASDPEIRNALDISIDDPHMAHNSGGLPTGAQHEAMPPPAAGDPGPGAAEALPDEPAGEQERRATDPTPQDLGEESAADR